MDLKQLSTKKASDEGARCDLVDFNGEPLLDDMGEQMWIRCYGLDSTKSLRDRHLHSLRAAADEDDDPLSEDALDKKNKRTFQQLAGLVCDWYLQLGGECPELTEESATELFIEFPWIATQVDRFVADRANYLGNV